MRKIHWKSQDFWFDAVAAVVLFALLLLTAYPIYFVLIASVSNPSLVNMGEVVLWPKEVTWEGYRKVFEYKPLWIGYRNTIFYVVIHTVMAVAFRMMAGYAMSRRDLVGRKFLNLFFVLTMFFGAGLIPSYLTLKALHMTGSVLVVLLMGTVTAYSIIVCRTFIQSSIPEELYEAACMDGCSHTHYFLRVVLPLSKAILAVQVLFAAVGQWNSWFNYMIYLHDEDQMPLQMVLRDLLIKQTQAMNAVANGTVVGADEGAIINNALVAETMKYSTIVVATVPIMCVYPFLQKYFVKGIMVGSVKG